MTPTVRYATHVATKGKGERVHAASLLEGGFYVLLACSGRAIHVARLRVDTFDFEAVTCGQCALGLESGRIQRKAVAR